MAQGFCNKKDGPMAEGDKVKVGLVGHASLFAAELVPTGDREPSDPPLAHRQGRIGATPVGRQLAPSHAL